MNTNARIDALQLMLTDLRMRNEPIRHKAAFRGCQPEFQSLVSRLIEQLETELLDEKQRFREAVRTAEVWTGSLRADGLWRTAAASCAPGPPPPRCLRRGSC